MNELILKQFDKDDIRIIKRKKLYLVSFFPSYITELYDIYGFDGEISGVFDLDEEKHGEKEAYGHAFCVTGMEEIVNCPADSVLMITTGYFEEEFDRLKTMPLPETVDKTIYFLANTDTKYYLSYHKKYKDQSLRDIIVFRSSTGTWEYVPGMDYTDNAKALFEFMLRERYNRKYKLVWLVKDPSAYSDIESHNENVSFISFDWAVSEDEGLRKIYYENICLAKYFFFTQASAFCRLKREGQTRVQLWHGNGPKAEKLPVRQERHYEYMTVTSDYYAIFHKNDFGLRDDQMLVTGLPKDDWILHPIENWREIFDIPSGEKYVFWLPTFRNTFSVIDRFNTNIKSGIEELQLFESDDMLSEMDKWLSDHGIVLVIKKHPLQKTERHTVKSFSNIVFLENAKLAEKRIHINEILGGADALISDYSSVAVDFLLADKPIGFVTVDKEQFNEKRGLYDDNLNAFYPGDIINSIDDMKCFLAKIASGVDDNKDHRMKSKELSHKYADDQSCKRLIDRLGV